MATWRVPIVLAESAGSVWTAACVEWNGLAAVAFRADDARQDLSRLVKHLVDRGSLPEPDFREPTLLTISVGVRPEYRTLEMGQVRVHPQEEEFALPVPAVTGTQQGGLLMASLPLLDLRFNFYEPLRLKGLVSHTVQQALQGASPTEVLRWLPPLRIELAELVVRTPRRFAGRGGQQAPATLAQVAEPLLDREFRNRFSRA